MKLRYYLLGVAVGSAGAYVLARAAGIEHRHAVFLAAAVSVVETLAGLASLARSRA